MPTVTGTLKDFGLASISDRQPQIIFTPSGPAFSGSNILATTPIVATPDGSGAFSVTLTSSATLRPATWYAVRIEWLDSASNFMGVDIVDRLDVPPAGGAIGDLASIDFNPTSVYASPTAPSSPAVATWWLNTTTGDLFEWSA